MENYEELLKRLRTSIIAELNLCDMASTPYLCRSISDDEAKEKTVDRIVRLVEKGYTISRAIVLLEQEYDPDYEMN